MVPELNMNAAQRHIELISGTSDAAVRFRLIHDRDKTKPAIKLRGSLWDCWPDIEAAQSNGYGVFVVVNEGGDTDAEISEIRAIFIDADNVAMVERWHVPPDFVVQRDDLHWHAYWLITDLPVAQFRQLQKRLARHYGTDPAVCNPSRVMRLAGTLHQKGGAL